MDARIGFANALQRVFDGGQPVRFSWLDRPRVLIITVAHAVKVSEGVSCNDTAWLGPDGAVSSLTNGWSGSDCHGAATTAGIAVV